MISNARSLWARRDLLVELVAGELKATSAETRLGWFWWLLDPMLMIAVYWLFKVVLLGRGKYAPYPIFLGAALLAWQHLVTSGTRSVRLLRAYGTLIRAVPFPTIVLPLAQVLSQFVFFLVSMAVLAVAAVLFGCEMTWTVVQIPPLALLQLVFVAGFALVVACFGALVRDLENLLTHLLRIGWYLSPGIYGIDLVIHRLGRHATFGVGKAMLAIYAANPFAILFAGYRGAIFEPRWLEPGQWVTLAVEAVLALSAGYAVFRHYDRRVIKFL